MVFAARVLIVELENRIANRDQCRSVTALISDPMGDHDARYIRRREDC
jgi:hypothetical protein